MKRVLGGAMIGSAMLLTLPASAQLQEPRLPAGGAFGDYSATGRPIEAFKGCKAPQNLSDRAAGASDDPMRTLNSSLQDPATARVFAAIPILEPAASQADLEQDCRYRLDGVWIEQTGLELDDGKAPSLFGAPPGRQLNPRLTHANYTTPQLIYLAMEPGGNTLTIRPATSGQRPSVFTSRDGVPMSDVMTPSGASKRYASQRGTSLEVTVSRLGEPQLRLGNTTFVRPKPTVTQRQEIASTNVFFIANNLDNYRASMRGYDIVSQDPFELNRNSKADIFATADPRDFAIVEKRTVPLGLQFVPENVQGSVSTSTLISSQFGFQRTSASSFGFNVGFQMPFGKKKGGNSKGGGAARSVANLSAGAEFAKSSTIGRQFGMQRSVSMGFARHKLYTLVLDRPFAKLSDDFIDAVDFALRRGEYDQLIDRFGTHFPYAVSYGSQARVWASFDQRTMKSWTANNESQSGKAGVALLGFNIGVNGSRFEATERNSEQLSQTSDSDFEAVGGTGSFDQGGFSTGTPVPILADLRPISELLNPLYFPGEPQVWGQVRARLDAAIERRLREGANTDGFASVIPQRPKPGLIKNITVRTHTGSRENVRVAFGRNTFQPGKVRVCFRNFKAGTRAMSHRIKRVNPFRVVGKGKSCATMGANQTMRLKFSAADREGSKILGATTFDLAPYSNGYVDFLYGVGP